MKNIYLAGAMTGLPDYNYDHFVNTAARLRQDTSCHIVHTANAPRGNEWSWYIDMSIKMIRACDAVAVLPNSDDSKGVKAELQEAAQCDIPVFFLPDSRDLLVAWAKG